RDRAVLGAQDFSLKFGIWSLGFGASVTSGRVFFRKPAVINGFYFAALARFDIAAFQNPIAAQGRKSTRHIKIDIVTSPRAARVVNTHGLVDFNLARHCLRRREIYFAK